GPCLSISSILAKYFSAMERAVNFPEAIPDCRSAMVSSSKSNGLICGVGESVSSRALAKAGNIAALTPAKALLCKKLRRCGELQLKDASSSFGKPPSPVKRYWPQSKRNYRAA